MLYIILFEGYGFVACTYAGQVQKPETGSKIKNLHQSAISKLTDSPSTNHYISIVKYDSLPGRNRSLWFIELDSNPALGGLVHNGGGFCAVISNSDHRFDWRIQPFDSY